MSNIIEIPSLGYDDENKIYYECGSQLINIDNISIVEPRYYTNTGDLSRYIIHFFKDVYTYTNQRGYDLIKLFERKKNEKTQDTLL